MLKQLDIFALRGATKRLVIPFVKDKNITIIYGENASGKTTICDAMELLSRGDIGSLKGKGLGKTEGFWHSTGKKQSEIEVTLTTSNGQWVAKVNKSKVFLTPSKDCPRIVILRRNNILDLIAQQPKNRFDVVRPFLNTEKVEISEANLKNLISAEKANQQTASVQINENRIAIENFWKAAGSPGKASLEWAQNEAAKSTAELQKEIELIEKLIKSIDKLKDEYNRLNQYDGECNKAITSVDDAKKKVAQENKKLSENLKELVGILEAAKTYFATHKEPEKCPLCGSKEFAMGLPERVDTQLAGIHSFTGAIRLQTEAEKKLELANKLRDQQNVSFEDAGKELSNIIKGSTLPSLIAIPTELIATAKDFPVTDDDHAKKLAKLNELTLRADVSLGKFREFLEKGKEKKGFLETLNLAVATYDQNYSAKKDLDILLPRLEEALEVFQNERQRFVDDILKSIASRVGGLYERIHPGEGLSKISLLLDPDKRASLEILCPFPQAGDVPPGAYLSDSHLDSLGFCIWLAMTELHETKNQILVLDDIVASVDEPHVERLIFLLYDVAQNYEHCIVTTHYRPWREKYRWGWLRNGQIHFVELMTWSHDKGIIHGKALPPLDELRELLSKVPLSPQLISSSAGVILEAILDFLTLLYECAVPRRKGKPTLGDLLPSVKGKLRKALKIERLESSLGSAAGYQVYMLDSILDDLQNLAQARNVFGAHFNELAHYLGDADAITFSSKVLELADLLIDMDCGWPGSDKSGSYWSNSKDTRRLHPLIQPS